MICYRVHKPVHENDSTDQAKAQSQPKKDRPGTTQRVPKICFTDFEADKEFIRLLQRYPLLRIQLQTVYGLTLEPGPEESRTWNKQPLPPLPGYDAPVLSVSRGRGRNRGGRGGRGNRRGGHHQEPHNEEREYGRWTLEKGDREAVNMIAKMRQGDGKSDDDVAEGMREFVELVRLRYGEKDVS